MHFFQLLTREWYWGHSDGKKTCDRQWSLSDSSSESVSSSDNEIDDIAVADAIVNDDSGDEEEILHRDFRWETMDNYTGHKEVFSCDFGPRNGAENVTLYNVLIYFLAKKS